MIVFWHRNRWCCR